MLATDEQDLISLKAALLKKSIRFGDFTLVSGDKSDVYVDAKLTTCSAQWISVVGRVFLRKIQARQWFPEAVGGLTLGADPIALAIACESMRTGAPINAFIVRKEEKAHGRKRSIEGLEHTAGVPVVILDDVCTRGESTATAIEKAIAADMIVLGAICLVDREMQAGELIASRFGAQLERIFTLSELRSASETHEVLTSRKND
ncbi:MAG: orotate phosphoribosyltransferase [Bryobacteraceae bacterium]